MPTPKAESNYDRKCVKTGSLSAGVLNFRLQGRNSGERSRYKWKFHLQLLSPRTNAAVKVNNIRIYESKPELGPISGEISADNAHQLGWYAVPQSMPGDATFKMDITHQGILYTKLLDTENWTDI